ncbi:hypothetical protein WQE_08497 [Paraburkholderia hospita]|uniref:Uncharacterized protein n=1 Tax=Paraburkholderia hospita TaxID=169430 RepID=A0ABP2PUN7_9BURK|nr:hypothetical protein [Paraburkholderia hospita]EIN01531.1 hypothetical protein WQE_08497 [Paraburkholderia hospita]OUL83633.1 hypothetical protein CA602_21685 [Paraburkholderia hospita]
MKASSDHQQVASALHPGRTQHGTDNNALLATLRDFTYDHAELGCYVVPTSSLPTSIARHSDEAHCLALIVGPGLSIDWQQQMADWVIPFNEVDYLEPRADTLVLLGDGPIAIEWTKTAALLSNAQRAISVIYVLPNEWVSVQYRWNPKFVDVLDELARTTRQFHDMEPEEMPHGGMAAAASRGLTAVKSLKPSICGYVSKSGELIVSSW